MSKRAVGGNAFDLLMKKKPKTPQSSSAKGSRFVHCPAGCGSHIPEHKVNEHLDSCVGSSTEAPAEAEVPSLKTAETEKGDHETAVGKNDASDDEPQQGTEAAQQCSAGVAATISQSPKRDNNIFSHMMKQSHRVFTTKEPLRQRFHLHSDGHLSWTNRDDEQSPSHEAWSVNVLLKASRMTYGDSTHHHFNEPEPRDVELTVSSSIPTGNVLTTPLVKRHSRLSVPVLKSILQKSVRRRRPLPAVRVAMELMDKAMGELLRRLPIIILEDSTLHPESPLLVWVMVAESKDFVIPPQLITRVLCIVYEIASCPWTDYIDDEEPHAEQILLSSPIPLLGDVDKAADCEMLLRSVLLRAQYGGMAGDMKMLHDYVNVWNTRFRESTVPTDVAKRADPTATSDLKWIDVPTAIHARPKTQSSSHAIPLVQTRLDKISSQDICLAGVDFHCSSVLDHVIANEAEYKRCLEGLCGVVVQAGFEPVPTDKDKQRAYLMQAMKKCMWKFSSGVNHRLPLCSDPPKDKDAKEAALQRFWDDALLRNVENFTKKYVQDRLAR